MVCPPPPISSLLSDTTELVLVKKMQPQMVNQFGQPCDAQGNPLPQGGMGGMGGGGGQVMMMPVNAMGMGQPMQMQMQPQMVNQFGQPCDAMGNPLPQAGMTMGGGGGMMMSPNSTGHPVISPGSVAVSIQPSPTAPMAPPMHSSGDSMRDQMRAAMNNNNSMNTGMSPTAAPASPPTPAAPTPASTTATTTTAPAATTPDPVKRDCKSDKT